MTVAQANFVVSRCVSLVLCALFLFPSFPHSFLPPSFFSFRVSFISLLLSPSVVPSYVLFLHSFVFVFVFTSFSCSIVLFCLFCFFSSFLPLHAVFFHISNSCIPRSFLFYVFASVCLFRLSILLSLVGFACLRRCADHGLHAQQCVWSRVFGQFHTFEIVWKLFEFVCSLKQASAPT